VTWEDGALAGTSEVVGGDEYAIYVTEPPGFTVESVRADGAEVTGQALENGTRVIRLLNRAGGTVRWRIRYRGPSHAPAE
jgi:hypothetical protein